MKYVDKKRILIVSYLPWSNEISVGNTLSNLFAGLENEFVFASLYFKGGIVNNGIAKRYFYISEKELAKSIFNRRCVGKEIAYPEEKKNFNISSNGIYNKARAVRWDFFLLCQDCIGILGKWQSKKLDEFIENFKPDVIFGPLGRVPVANLVMEYIHIKYEIPVIVYAWDDHYSLNKKSLSPFFWMKTMLERNYIKRCAAISSFMYTITEAMRDEYREYFNKDCKVLYKAYDFEGEAPIKSKINCPIKIVFMGNLGSGRWQELSKLVNVVSNINSKGKKANIMIYSLSPKTKDMVEALDVEGTSSLMEPVSNENVILTMKGADILVHVEPTNEKDRLFFRLSFSTKIVDYLYNARCILAFGGKTASIEYLKKNNAAVIVNDMNQLEEKINYLLESPEKIIQMGRQAWNCGIRNHQRIVIQSMLSADIKQIIIENYNNSGEGV